MVNPEFQRQLELLGPDAENDPRVRGLTAVPGLNPKMTVTAIQLLGGILRQAGIDPDDPRSLPLVRRLPDAGARLGTVINGTREGPVFHIPEGTASDLENVGLFGLPRWGKTFILMAIALYSMLNGNVCWLFDVEDQLPCLVDAVPEPYKPVTLTPEHLRINIFEPPSDRISLKLWLQAIAFLLRGEVYIRNGGQNLFEASLRKLLKQKGAFEGSGRYPSLAETLCYFQSLRLGGSEVRGKAWLESLVNRMTMLVNTYEPTSRVTNSNMLHLLVNKSVIFRFQNMRGVALHFLTTFLLTWLAAYRQSATDVNKVLTL